MCLEAARGTLTVLPNRFPHSLTRSPVMSAFHRLLLASSATTNTLLEALHTAGRAGRRQGGRGRDAAKR